MSGILKKAGSGIFLIWCFLVFISAMIMVFPFILISSVLFIGRKAQNIFFFFLKIWAGIFSILCFFPVRAEGRRSSKPKKAYIYVCNHNSYLDAIAVVLAIPGSFKPLGKIEMVKTPIFGMIYRRVVVLIDRKDKESRTRGVEELKIDLAGGQSILIFPEGTMNRSKEPLAEFYDGAFRLAIETQTDIAPLVILNARKLLPRNKPFAAKPGLLTCVFAEPVKVKGLTADDLEDLKSIVRKSMESIIQNA